MRVEVGKDCVGCGICAYHVPEVFHMSDEGTSVPIQGQIPAHLEQKVKEAQDNCPASVIKVFEQ
ncbi:MAG: ferredoxin [Lachnospiraceae bacterium]|nr:ferredoxin [Lachnospiraceae bacterium]